MTLAVDSDTFISSCDKGFSFIHCFNYVRFTNDPLYYIVIIAHKDFVLCFFNHGRQRLFSRIIDI